MQRSFIWNFWFWQCDSSKWRPHKLPLHLKLASFPTQPNWQNELPPSRIWNLTFHRRCTPRWGSRPKENKTGRKESVAGKGSDSNVCCHVLYLLRSCSRGMGTSRRYPGRWSAPPRPAETRPCWPTAPWHVNHHLCWLLFHLEHCFAGKKVQPAAEVFYWPWLKKHLVVFLRWHRIHKKLALK